MKRIQIGEHTISLHPAKDGSAIVVLDFETYAEAQAAFEKLEGAAAASDPLYQLWRGFIAKHEITCPEAVHASGRATRGSYEAIEESCRIVGYHKVEEET